MQYTVDAVNSGCSTQWMQWNSGVWWWGQLSFCIHCIHCILRPLHTVSTAYYIHCIHWFDIFAPKTMSPPPYTTIPLHSLCTASTVYCVHSMTHCLGWPFCTKGNSPYHPYLLSPLCELTFLHLHLLRPLLSYMPYVINLFALTKCPPHLPTLLVTHETIMNQKLVISNQYLMSPPPTKKVPKIPVFSLRGHFKPLR